MHSFTIYTEFIVAIVVLELTVFQKKNSFTFICGKT